MAKKPSRTNPLEEPLPRAASKVDGLDAESRKVYSRLLPVFDRCGVTTCSLDFVVAYCWAYKIAADAYKRISVEGHTMGGSKPGSGQYLHPSVTAWKMALNELERNARYLSISPELIALTLADIKDDERAAEEAGRKEQTLVEFTAKRTG